MPRIVTEFFFIILFFRFGVLHSISEGPKLLYHYCGLNSTENVTHSFLFLSLLSEAYHSDIGFASTTTNIILQDQSSGLITCYIGSSKDDCSDCLNGSLNNSTIVCPNSTNAYFTYDSCFLRYSNENFRGVLTLDKQPNIYRNPDIVSNPSTLEETVYDLLNSLRLLAMSSTLLYAYGNKTDPGMNQKVYGLVQCTRDLRQVDCGLCLQSIIGNLTSDLKIRQSKGVRVSCTSCYIRFEFYALPLPPFDLLAASPPNLPPPSKSTSRGSRTTLVVVVVISTFGVLLAIFVACVCFWRMQRRSSRENEDNSLEFGASGDCRMFMLSELKSATNNFSDENKLGQGGFGPVYKGTLPDGKQIAVKTLAGWSKQGFQEFKNEVELLGNLRHKNLVKLIGYCMNKNQKLLCYEYLPYGSLDCILFASDKIKREKLSWQTRYKIIEGISSGLQYLHKESGLKIVHRDLKPSNILLDEDMNSKISDFGLARLYQDDGTHKETSVIAGTYGYMAPEYAMHGMYSEKLDVYSFGMMLLEIVTGINNSSFRNNQLASSLVNHVWQHWDKGELEVLKDPTLENACLKQLSRCINIGLLCVQESPISRPNMAEINLMLRNDSNKIPALPAAPSRPQLLLSQNSTSGTSNSNIIF